jgi:hypothetical protein
MFTFPKIPRRPLLPPEVSERNGVVAELKAVRSRMEEIDNLYNLTNDMDLIDYYILESKALVARYRFLMRLIREYDMRCPSEPAHIDG